jgi:hypothetical protein
MAITKGTSKDEDLRNRFRAVVRHRKSNENLSFLVPTYNIERIKEYDEKKLGESCLQ